MKKYTIILLIIIAITASVLLFLENKNTSSDGTSKNTVSLKISTSFPLYAELIKNIGGENITLVELGNTAVDVHDFEPTPKDVAHMYETRIFVYHGAGLDPWAEKLAPELAKQNIETIEMTKNLELFKEENTNKLNPHTWLDPTLLQKNALIIRDALIALDPAHTDAYTINTAAQLAELNNVDEQFQMGLKNCEKREIIIAHDSLHYLAKRYNIIAHPISGLDPESEPSAEQLAALADLAKEKKITYIFFESLVSPKLAETLASEVGAQTIVFESIEGFTPEQKNAGIGYAQLMQKNLQNLQTALICAQK